jgi:4-hydroxythreonine-4-phosphate dehydrogenase
VEPSPEPAKGDPRPLIAVSMGDPLGIGPEIILKVLADPLMRGSARFRVYGSEGPMLAAAGTLGIAPWWCRGDGDGDPDQPVLIECGDGVVAEGPPRPTAGGGRVSFDALRHAIEAVRRGDAAALVTAPIAKESWKLAGERYPGHTEYLAAAFEAERVAMLFVGPTLRVILVTIHVPLRDVARMVTEGRVLDTIELGARACSEMGVGHPRVAVAGLNPHAGEGGMFGDEDERVIRPAVERARGAGIDASGPWPGDAVFLAAAKGKYDLVVAMYHDQGLIPVKLVDREEAVNVTVGLPIIRTSPAHGTAFDIAGRGVASAASMRAAVRVAVEMAAAKRGRSGG